MKLFKIKRNRDKLFAQELIAVLAISMLGGFILFQAIQQNSNGELSVSNDSKFYHLMAVNLIEGLPFRDLLQQNVDKYDPFTQDLLSKAGSLPTESRPYLVTPGYPLFLATVYSAFGLSGEVVLRSQLLFSWVIGMMMVIAGYLLWGRLGTVIALGAILVLSNLPDFGYQFYALLTESFATVLCLLTFLLAIWAKRDESVWRESLVGIGMVAMILTRPGFLFCGVAYAGLLLFPVTKKNVVRSMLFILPVAIGLSAWSFQAWKVSGEVPFVGHAITAVKLGLRGESGAQRARMAAAGERLDNIEDRDFEKELTSFFMSPGKTVKIIRDKFETTIERVPRFFWVLACLGFSVFVSGMLERTSTPRISQKYAYFTFVTVAFLCILVGLGWSSSLIQALLLVFPIVAAVLSVFSRWLENRGGHTLNGFENWWVLAWYLGFIAIPMLTIGLSRYFRPFMPVFALFAVFALPAVFSFRQRAKLETSQLENRS
jgi:hypothetical protein